MMSIRGTKGKHIVIWSPVLHQEGVSTIACGLGIALEQYTLKRTLIINRSGIWSYLEKYLENNIEIKHPFDQLKVFNSTISEEQILAFSTKINNNLNLIAASFLPKELSKEDLEFETNFMEKSLGLFDIVISDLPTGVREENEKLLESADLIIAVVTPNEIMLDEIFSMPLKENVRNYLNNPKTLIVFNKMDQNWDIDKELSKICSKYNLNRENTFGMLFDGSVFDACCRKKKMYTYLKSEFTNPSSIFPEQLKDLCSIVATKLNMGVVEVKKESMIGKLLKKVGVASGKE